MPSQPTRPRKPIILALSPIPKPSTVSARAPNFEPLPQIVCGVMISYLHTTAACAGPDLAQPNSRVPYLVRRQGTTTTTSRPQASYNRPAVEALAVQQLGCSFIQNAITPRRAVLSNIHEHTFTNKEVQLSMTTATSPNLPRCLPFSRRSYCRRSCKFTPPPHCPLEGGGHPKG